jgi:glycosyltransferase involved in cell wall biosynthesis
MKLLLTSTASYDPPKGGSTRSNLAWLKHLAASGHEIRIVAGSDAPTRLRREIEDFQPDWLLVSSEDLAHALLREAFRTAPDRIVYLAHTPQFFPFGPQSWNPESDATDLIRRAAAVIVISQSVADYVEQHLGRKPEVIHPPMYDAASPCQNPNGAVTMINPCAVKGLPIFLALADRLPDTEFHALRGWGTSAEDEAAIRRRTNIELVEPVADIEEELRRTKVLLMPSLWFEGFGLIVMEAMLRGIPVIASDAGGLVEAKLGTRFVIPVNPIQQAAAEELRRTDAHPARPQFDLLSVARRRRPLEPPAHRSPGRAWP